jgi:hypothetical protein
MDEIHASMEIIDQFYSNMNDGELENQISGLNKQNLDDDVLDQFRQFL